MSRGGRGGFGGGRGGLSSAARLNSGAVPFDIDEELEKEFAKQKEDSDNFFPVSRPQIAVTLSHPTITRLVASLAPGHLCCYNLHLHLTCRARSHGVAV
jgi:hypothetical protein